MCTSETKDRGRGGGQPENEMCPFTRRFTLKDSLVVVTMMPDPMQQVRRGECSPGNSQASTISLDTVDQQQWQPGTAPSVDERINEILLTLNSLSAELVNISRERRQDSSERLPVNSSEILARETRIGGEVVEESLTEEEAFQRWRTGCTNVKLNVGGKVFHVSWSLMLQVGRLNFSSPFRCPTPGWVTLPPAPGAMSSWITVIVTTEPTTNSFSTTATATWSTSSTITAVARYISQTTVVRWLLCPTSPTGASLRPALTLAA